MDPGAASAAVRSLAPVQGREIAARALAVSAGADEMILLVRNPQATRMLPAPGLRKTLPGGPRWKAFVERCGESGFHRGELNALDRDASVRAAACSNGQVAMILIGGEVADTTLQALSDTLPLLGELLDIQLTLGICQGDLSAARFEMRQYASLARSLDDARAQLDDTVRELGRQAQQLTEQRARAESATRAKDEFMAMLGHELRNPLAPIVTALQVMRLRGQWSPEHAILQRQVEHLQRLVDDLLDVSRIARGKLVLKRRVIELADAVDAALETAHPLIAAKRQELDIQVLRAGLPVLADPPRLAQVFANLLTNASKYSAAGTRIVLRATRVKECVSVEVADRGVGIAPGMLARVFDMFEQESSTLDRAQGGLGLGLSIVRNLVSQHDGEVTAHSDGQGHGSTFSVTLPIAHEQLADTPTDPTDEVGDPAGRRILVVDDNADARSTLSLALRLIGFVVEVAADGEHALRVARDFRPEVAILDIGLPLMDGYALAGALRATSRHDLRLVALTGYGQPHEKQKALECGFDAHFVKPVDFGALRRVLDRLFAVDRA